MQVFRDKNLKYSQNFLYNKKLVIKLVQMANLAKNDTVIEIGAGKGIITEILSKYARKIIALEKDIDLYQWLELQFKNVNNIELLNEDILKYNFSKNNNYKIFSNIPFNITTEIINKVLSSEIKPRDMFLIIQKETANRFIGNPYSKESLKSILLKSVYDTEIIYKFNNYDFKPTPNVDIVFVHFSINTKIDINDSEMFKDFISYLFMINQKTINQKLKKLFTYNQIKQIARTIDINNTITTLTFEEWIYIFNIFKTKATTNSKAIIKNYYKEYIKIQSNLDKRYRSRK